MHWIELHPPEKRGGLMAIISASDCTKYFGARLILSSIGFNVNPGQKIGLIGRNGSGKTTLLRLILGREVPSSGTIHVQSGAKLGYVPQNVTIDENLTAIRYLLSPICYLLSAIRYALAGNRR